MIYTTEFTVFLLLMCEWYFCEWANACVYTVHMVHLLESGNFRQL